VLELQHARNCEEMVRVELGNILLPQPEKNFRNRQHNVSTRTSGSMTPPKVSIVVPSFNSLVVNAEFEIAHTQSNL
jgi:hypothetical protein